MNPTTSSTSPTTMLRAARRLTVADFTTYEHRYHLTHHFPALQEAHCQQEGMMVAEGYIDEYQPWRGLQLVGSDLTVHQTYETHARKDAPAHVSIIVMLEGSAELILGDQHRTLTPGSGLLLAYSHPQPLSARHIAGQRVRAVNLTVLQRALSNDSRLAMLVPLFQPGASLRPMTVPAGLQQSLLEWISSQAQSPFGNLLAEGLALQLLAQALTARDSTPPSDPFTPTTTQRLSSRDRRLLEHVRTRLDTHPGEAHSLKALASLACMSPSTLREKFRQVYGQSVFDYLREQRLAQAYQLLEDGASVQQAAAQVGYRHATNFATAFRHRYGMAPSDISEK